MRIGVVLVRQLFARRRRVTAVAAAVLMLLAALTLLSYGNVPPQLESIASVAPQSAYDRAWFAPAGGTLHSDTSTTSAAPGSAATHARSTDETLPANQAHLGEVVAALIAHCPGEQARRLPDAPAVVGGWPVPGPAQRRLAMLTDDNQSLHNHQAGSQDDSSTAGQSLVAEQQAQQPERGRPRRKMTQLDEFDLPATNEQQLAEQSSQQHQQQLGMIDTANTQPEQQAEAAESRELLLRQQLSSSGAGGDTSPVRQGGVLLPQQQPPGKMPDSHQQQAQPSPSPARTSNSAADQTVAAIQASNRITPTIPAFESYRYSTTLTMFVIADIATFDLLEPELRAIMPDRQSWRVDVDEVQPQLILIQPSWTHRWRDDLFSSNESTALIQMVEYARLTYGTKSIYWNTEDPHHFDQFVHSSILRHVDGVFTTEEQCVAKYRAVLGHERVGLMPMGVQPARVNPIGMYRPRTKGYAFAGTYGFQDKFLSRTQWLDMMLLSARERGLVIYDRNSHVTSDAVLKFPTVVYGDLIRPSLRFNETIAAYQSHDVQINVNSVMDSHTTCSRRALDATLRGTPVLSSPSPAMANFLGQDGVVEIHSPDDVVQAMQRLDSTLTRERIALNGQRRLLASHTMQHLLHHALTATDLNDRFPQPSKHISLAVCLPLDPCSYSTNEADIKSFRASCVHSRTMAAVRLVNRVVIDRHMDLSIGFFLRENLPSKSSNTTRCATFETLARELNATMTKHLNPAQPRVLALNGHPFAREADCYNYAVSSALPQTRFITFPNVRHYYGRNFFRDLLPAFDYTFAAIVGKSSVYATLQRDDPTRACHQQLDALLVSDLAHAYPSIGLTHETLGLELYRPELQNEYVDSLGVAVTAVFRMDVFQQLQFARDVNRPLEQLLRRATQRKIVMYSTNRHNFILNNQSGECSLPVISDSAIAFTSW
ncbi:hypothetical protein CAOG_003937 [Capsaspora owczarzaki ATCC 30864]|uniref:Spore protein YkvP/CgeB glycosyl transferase-like domain-containing protein n=1 Tax=Capsaspora owczarzaki (strain ATCC 30864) TaxID=595528 RepID=A0A0D2VQU1_CAPO3|nr:hypothetical protein CAOG_003937 [Capsaspora owczarzaki ATCC 30864]